jgi:hypothetical protein
MKVMLSNRIDSKWKINFVADYPSNPGLSKRDYGDAYESYRNAHGHDRIACGHVSLNIAILIH